MRAFLFELALMLRMTVGELERVMSARELQEWLTFFRLYPHRPEAINAAKICSVVANVNGNDTSPSDFLPPIPDEDDDEDGSSEPDEADVSLAIAALKCFTAGMAGDR